MVGRILFLLMVVFTLHLHEGNAASYQCYNSAMRIGSVSGFVQTDLGHIAKLCNQTYPACHNMCSVK